LQPTEQSVKLCQSGYEDCRPLLLLPEQVPQALKLTLVVGTIPIVVDVVEPILPTLD